MTELEKAARHALNVFEYWAKRNEFDTATRKTITALRRALQSGTDVEQQPAEERLELIGHADLAINNIYIFNGYAEEVPEGRTPIYAGYKRPQPAASAIQEWIKPHPKCDEACLYQCTKGFAQFPECATQPADEPVGGQCRFTAQPWAYCSVEHAEMVMENPHEWEGYEVRFLYTRPQPAERVKVWEAEGYEALMQEMQMVKARNIRQQDEIERLSALVRAQQITIDKLEQQPAAQITDEQIQDLLKIGNPTEEEIRLIRLGYAAAQPAAPQRSEDKKQWVHATEWRGLTDDEIALICGECAASAHRHDDISFSRAIEAKLKEKNA